MTFWSDRFRRDDEDDIWKELRQMLMNPPNEQELVQKKKQEQAWIDSILNKAFPGVNEMAGSRDYKLESELKKGVNEGAGSCDYKLESELKKGVNEGATSYDSKLGSKVKKLNEGAGSCGSKLDSINSSKQSLEGFGNVLGQGINSSKKNNEFLDIGKSNIRLKESFAPIENNKNLNRNTLVSTNSGYANKQKESHLGHEDFFPIKTNKEQQIQKAIELEAFNRAWNKVNGIKENNALIDATTDINKKIKNGINEIKNMPQNLLQKTKNKVFENANKDFDKNAPMTIEEKAVQQGIEILGSGLFPMSSNATKNGMHEMESAKNQNNVKVYDNLESLEDTKLKDTLKKIGAKDSDKGAIYGVGSRESETFSNSPELDEYLTKNRAKVLAGKPLEDTSLYYDSKESDIKNNRERFDRYATARKITVLNPNVDENGIFTCDLVDYSNFANEPVDSIGTYLNKWGYKMQEKGYYKPHYQIIKIRKKLNW